MTKCRNCGDEHSGGCAQFFASQSGVPPKAPQAKASASNTASNRSVSHASNNRASNPSGDGATPKPRVVGRGVARDVQAGARSGAAEAGSVVEAAGGGDKKQRWSREDYNAYQRELMRKRRAAP